MIINSKLLPKPVVLYSGGTTSSATLSKSIVNFKRIKVFGVSTDGEGAYAEIFNNNSATINGVLITARIGGTDNYMSTASFTISNQILTLSRQGQTRIRNNGNATITSNTNIMKITRIEGYTD